MYLAMWSPVADINTWTDSVLLIIILKDIAVLLLKLLSLKK